MCRIDIYFLPFNSYALRRARPLAVLCEIWEKNGILWFGYLAYTKITQISLCCANTIWASTQEKWSLVFVNNKGTDQPAHARRLVSGFVIRFLKNIISKLASVEISIF